MEELEESPPKAPGVEEDMTETEMDLVVRGWVSWCRSHAFVKCAEVEVPIGVLPKGYRGLLIDVKVEAEGAPDDKVYSEHEELRDKVARGNCVLELSKIENGEVVSTKYIFLVFALKKYSGGLGDDGDAYVNEEDPEQWQNFFTKPLSEATSLISTEKANGEASHFSSLRLFGQTYFCLGSKNVHMLVRNGDDILKYTGRRFNTARTVATSFFTSYLDNPEIPEHKKQSLIYFLQENKCTGVAEMIQCENRHIVGPTDGMKGPELKFICWTRPDLGGKLSDRDSYCALPVNECIDKAREFGLWTIDYERVDLTRKDKEINDIVEEYTDKIRNDHGYEGKVLYFLDKDKNTIGLIKMKTLWYILLRQLRQISGPSKNKISDFSKVAKRKVKENQRWLGFSDNYADSWIKIFTSFLQWRTDQERNKNVRSPFPILFDNFLKENADMQAEFSRLLECTDMKTY